MKNNFGLSEKEFEQLRLQLKSDDLLLFEKIFLSHFKDCIAYIEKNYRASYEDAYDATMDTLLDFRRRILLDKIKYGNLRYLFTKMATQVYLKNMSAKKSTMTPVGMKASIITPDEMDISVLDQSWPELSRECQDLLKLHFYGKAKLAEIADEVGKSASSIRKQKERCLGKLKNLFAKHSKAYQDV